MTIERLQPQVEVRINGVARTLLGGGANQGVRSAFPTSTTQLDIAEGKPSPGDVMEVAAGYISTGIEIVASNEIDVTSVNLAPNDVAVQTTHTLARTQEAIGVPPTIVEGEAEQTYFLAWENATASQVIGDILDAYGITQYSLADSGRLFNTLYTADDPRNPLGLMASDNGWNLIKQLDEVEGYQTFGVADGSVRRVPFIGIPSAVGRTFTQEVDIFTSRMDESRINTKNRVIASGLPQPGTTGVDFVPTAERAAVSPWIPTPPGYRVHTFNSPFLETEEQCDQYCQRKLGELNRLRGEVPFELVTGDQTLRPGMSIAIDAFKLDVRTNVRFRVLEVVHSFDEGFHTSGTLLLASIGEGWSPNEAPIAIIAASAKVEYLGDGTKLVVVSLDGSASYDPELGKDGIVSYIWSGSPVSPTPMQSGQRANAVYVGGIPSGATITLTVTDDLGKTGSATIKPGAGGVKLKVRHLISAEKTRLQVSRDGCKTWQNVLYLGSPIAAVGTCEFAAALYTFAWDSGGNLYKVLADNTATLVLSGAGVTACGITLVNGDPAQPTGRVWTASADGSVRRSRADGDVGTWDILAPLPNGQAATYILESAFAEGDVEAAGGNVYYRTFDNAATWTAQVTHPNTALIAKRVASGFGKGWVGFAGGSAGADAGASRLKERADTVTLDALEPAKPISIQGLALDPYEDTAYVLDVDNGGSGRAFTGDTAIGGNLADTEAWDTVAWGVPRHMVRDGTAPGYLYISAVDSLLKSVDGLASILELKLLSGGPEGMMIGYGAEGAEPPPPAGDLVWSARDQLGADPCVMALTTGGFVRRSDPHPCAGQDGTYVLRAGADGTLYTYSRDSLGTNQDGYIPGDFGPNAYRSTDGGDTWDALGLSGVYHVAPGAGATAYAATMEGGTGDGSLSKLYRSDDGGATWDLVHTLDATTGGFARFQYAHLAASPVDALTVTAHGLWFVGSSEEVARQMRISTDGGATWTDLGFRAVDYAGFEGHGRAIVTNDGAWLLHIDGTTGSEPTLRSSLTGTPNRTPVGPMAGNLWFILGAGVVAAYGGGGAYTSVDDGGNWSSGFTPPTEGDGSEGNLAGYVPSDGTNAGYALPGASGNVGGTPASTFAVLTQTALAEPGEPWINLTPDLALAYPDDRWWCDAEGAARLPSVEE